MADGLPKPALVRALQQSKELDVESRLRSRILEFLESEHFGESADINPDPSEFKIAHGGGLYVHVAQDDRLGHWIRHGERGGRTLLSLIQHVLAPAEGAERWAEQWLAQPPDRHPLRNRVAREKASQQERIDWARLVWQRATLYPGPAQRAYLRSRAIDPRRLPPSCGSIMEGPDTGLVFAAHRFGEQWPHAVQHVYLTVQGHKRQERGLVKRSVGVLKDAAVWMPALPDCVDQSVYHAEGPETALTVWQATGCLTLAHLHGIPRDCMRFAPTATEHVLVADDSLPRHKAPAYPRLLEIAQEGMRGNFQMRVASPWSIMGESSADFNDLAQAGAILTPGDPLWYARKRLSDESGKSDSRSTTVAMVRPCEGEPAPLTASTTSTVTSLAEAEQALRDALRPELVTGWHEAVALHQHDPAAAPHPAPAPVYCLRVETGLGKTEQALRLAKTLIERGELGGVITAPTYRLACEIAERATALGIHARVMFTRLNNHTSMCANDSGVKQAIVEGVENIQKSLCGTSKQGCKHFKTCGFQRQRVAKPELWVTTTARLFSSGVEELPPIRWLIIDEGVVSSYLPGAPKVLDRALLRQIRERGDARIAWLLDKLERGLNLSWTESLSLSPAISVAELQELARRVGALKVDLGALHNLSDTAIRQLIETKAIPERWNAQLTTFLLMLIDLIPVADGKIIRSGRIKANESCFELYRPNDLLKAALGMPTFILDATLNLELTKFAFPKHTPVTLLADISFNNEHVTVVQDTTHWHAKSTISHKPRHLQDSLAEQVLKLAPAPTTLLIGQKAVVQEIRLDSRLDWLETAHFNSIRGLDHWKDVSRLIIAGQPRPTVESIETAASAITGERIADEHKAVSGRFGEIFTRIEGSSFVATALRHPHPLCESLRWQVMEGEIWQAIGRARGSRRTAQSCLEIVLFTKLVLKKSVDGLGSQQHVHTRN